MKETHIELGALVREYRQKADMTQLQLAKLLGYDSVQFVSLFERGLSKVPVETLGQLIIILRIPEKRIVGPLLKAYKVHLESEIQSGKQKAKEA